MPYSREKFDAYLTANHDRFLQELDEIISVPSVVAQNRGIQECADVVAARLERIGAKVRQIPTPNNGSPVVYAEIGDGDHTMMVYNHYDVQPEDPLDLWDTPPFSLTRKDGYLYGRGVVDNKGELLARIQAIEAWQETQGKLPVKVKFVLEGEEEIGSINLHAWAQENRDLLNADGVLWENGGYEEDGLYRISEGCKGIAYFELRVKGPGRDLHSSVAPMVENPAWRLVWALRTLKDEQDRITIDGYHDHVAAQSDEVINRIDEVPFPAEDMRANFGIGSWLNGMSDTEARRHYYLDPTVTICGILTGYTGKGSKTVLPSTAMAKLDCRLVPDLTPEIVQGLLRNHLDARGFQDIEITMLGGENPSMRSSDNALRRAAINATHELFGHNPILVPWLAGSGPMYALSDFLEIPAVASGGTWHPYSNVHAPNENILEKDYFNAIRLMAAIMNNLAAE